MSTRLQFKEYTETDLFDMFLRRINDLRLNKQARKAHDGEAWKFNTKIYFMTNAINIHVKNLVPRHGGKMTHYTHFCFHGSAYESFPEALMILINLCIDDEIWSIQYQDRKNSAHVAWMEENWPGGRPEDFEYQ